MYRMADQMRDFGYEVTAVLPSDEGIADWYDDSDIDTIELWSEPLRRRRSTLGQLTYLFFGLVATLRLAIYVRRNQIDIVHVNDVRFFPGIIAGTLGGARCICHVRANYESETVRSVLSKLILRFSDRVLCVSKRTREIMFEEVGLSTEQVDVLYDSVPDPERFEGDSDGRSFRAELDIDPEVPIVLNVSKMTANKAQDRVLDAAERVEDAVPNAVFVLVGGVVEGHEDYADTVTQRAEELSSVRTAGFVPDVTEALAASDISIHLPRHDDPFPGVVLEGMLAGNPVVGSRSGGIPEQIDHGEIGYLVPKNDGVEEITERLVSLCENDRERQKMGEEAARRCRRIFSPKRFFKSLDGQYRVALGN